jgi:Fuc2NAc and GlcNAc transferase
MKIILIISGLFILSFSLTALIRFIALKRKVISIPNERSLHVIPTPLGGGLAIIITWYSGINRSVFCFIEWISPCINQPDR